jgi:2-C-methyl-D-erythritol 4-phosphate cytidylyltransferase
MYLTAIIAAAGSGVRLGNAVPKQFLDLDGRPVLAWSLEAFAATGMVGEMVVVTRQEYMEQVGRIVSDTMIDVPVSVVKGGLTRQQSVENGLNACGSETKWIAVHDAARPFVEPEHIEGAALLARETGAAIVAEPVVDTIKETENNLVVRTLDRSILYKAQTPQICRRDDLLYAYRRAEKAGFQATDEASLLEFAGIPVAIFESNGKNFKITTETDLYIARAIASMDKNMVS